MVLSRGSLREELSGELVLAPLTKGGNLPFRRLCAELGARFTFSEMAVARELVRGKRQEAVLLRSHPDETRFGVQLAARDPEQAVAAALMAVERGAQFIDLNAGCPIHQFCKRGLGAALLQKPLKLQRILVALREALTVPLFVKIRSGYANGKENALRVAGLAEEAGVDALTVHGRTREQRYRRPADWGLIAEVAASVSIPVIGNGDVLHVSDLRLRLESTGCTAVMAARGALIQPWIFEDARAGADRPRGGEERLRIYRRWVELAIDCWGQDELAFRRIRGFLEFHADFWRRHVPLDAEIESGENALQSRADWRPRDALEAALRPADAAGLARFCDLVLEPFDPPSAGCEPSPGAPDPSAGGWH